MKLKNRRINAGRFVSYSIYKFLPTWYYFFNQFHIATKG